MNAVFYMFLTREVDSHADLALSEINWVYKNVNNELHVGCGSLTEAAEKSKGFQIAVVLKGEDVLFLNAEVPGNNMQRVRQAIPYLLEDSLIDDVDDLHFAIKKYQENNYHVAIINKLYFGQILSELKKSGINPAIVTTDYLLLDGDGILFSDGERVLYKSTGISFSVASTTDVSFNTLEPKKIIQCGTSKQQFLDDFTAIESEVCENQPFLCLLENSSVNDSVNLLQGEFKETKKWSETGKNWLPVAAVLLVWLSLQGGLFIADYIGYSQKNEALKNQINTIYKNTFPDAKRIVNAKAQMQQKLSDLQKRKGQSGRSFSNMLTANAAILSKTKGLKIKSLRYYDGRINLELELASLQVLEKLKMELSKNKGYIVEVKNASSTKNNVTAQLQISGVAS